MSHVCRSCPGVTVGAVLAAGGLIGGCIIGKYFLQKKSSHPAFWKSYESEDPLLKYVVDHSLRLEPVQKRLMEETVKHPQGGMMGAPEVCQLLQNLIRGMKMQQVIEVGVFTGFSTLGFALALPDDGKVIACDVSEEYAAIGRPYWKEAGIEHKIDLRIQSAAKSLDDLLEMGLAGTFDMAFIDADKAGYDNYYEKCLKLMRKGGLIAIDNVLWSNSVLDEVPTMRGAKEIKALNDKLAKDTRIDISMLILGDGLTLAFKR